MSPKKTKNSVKLRNDTPMATTVVSFPVTPYHHENPAPQEDTSYSRSIFQNLHHKRLISTRNLKKLIKV